MFAGSVAGVAGGAVFLALLGYACVSDWRERRIPNRLVLVLLVAGFIFGQLLEPGLAGLGRAAGGALVGLAIWFPFWLLRMLGAGDVKLFAAGAAWLGVTLAVEAALFTALVGGVIALLYMVAGQGISFTLLRLSHAAWQPGTLRDAPVSRGRTLPYGLAIAAGLLLAAAFPGLLL
jgi:prepilin peptidase CpaA